MDAAAPECAWLLDDILNADLAPRIRIHGNDIRRAVREQPLARAGDHINFGMSDEQLVHMMQRARLQFIVRAKPREDIAIGVLEPLVQTIRLPLVFLDDYRVELIAILLDRLPRFIRALRV